MLPVALAVGFAGLVLPAAAVYRRRRALAAVVPAPVVYFPKAEVPSPVEDVSAPAQALTPDSPPTERTSTVGVVVEGAAAFLTGNPVKAALALAETTGRVVEEGLGLGEGRGDLARIAGPAAIPAAVAVAVVDKVAEAIHLDQRTTKAVEQMAAVAAVGAPFLAPTIGLIHAGSALLNAISPEADAAARGFLQKFDPTVRETVPGAVLGAVGDFIGGVFGGDSEEAKRRKEEEERKRAEDAARREREAREAREAEERRLAEAKAEQERAARARAAAEAASMADGGETIRKGRGRY